MGMREKVLILCLLFVFFSAFTTQAKVEDIPEDHWAYDIVIDLVDRGFLALYDDETFRGQEDVTRYQMAEIIARILDYIDQYDVTLTEVDVENLRKLTVEFREELVALTEEIAFLQERLEGVEEFNVITAEDLGMFHHEQQRLQKEVSELVNEIVLLYALEEQLEEVDRRILEYESLINVMEKEIYESHTQIKELRDEIERNQETIESLQRQNRFMRYYLAGGVVGLIALIIIF